MTCWHCALHWVRERIRAPSCRAEELRFIWPLHPEDQTLRLLFCSLVGYCSAVNMLAPLDPYDPSVGSQYYD